MKRLGGPPDLLLPPPAEGVSPARLGFAVVGPPLGVALALLINIAFVRERCSPGGMITRYSALTLALAIAVAGTWTGWRIWKSLGAQTTPGDAQGTARDRWLAGGGTVFGLLMLLLIIYAFAVALVLDGCLRGVL